MVYESQKHKTKQCALSAGFFLAAGMIAPTCLMAKTGSPPTPTQVKAKNSVKPTELSDITSPRVKSFLEEVTKRIKRYWFPPKSPQSNQSVVLFKITRDGELQNPQLTKSSGDPLVDRMAIEAVANAAPFPHLPPDVGDDVDILFNFDYNVHGHANYNGGFGSPSFEAKLCLNLLKKARAFAEQHDLDSAIVTIQQELRIWPEDSTATGLGSRYLSQTVTPELRDDVAIAKLHQALVWDPYNTIAANNLNTRLLKIGIDPKSFVSRSDYGRNLAKDGDYDAAIYEMKMALKIKDDENVRAELAKMYSDRIAAARVKQWSQLLEKVSNAENHTGLGSAFAMMGQSDKARIEYEKALQIDANYTMARDLLAKLDKQ